jgi:hypothetical protein
MIIKGRYKTAPILCLLWLITAAASYHFVEFFDSSEFWSIMIISLFLLIYALVLFFGMIRAWFPFMVYSEEDMIKFNTEKISIILGIPLTAISCIFLFITSSVLVVIPIILIAVAMYIFALYASVAERFKVDPQQKGS